MGAIKHILYGHYMLITVELIKIRSLTVQEPAYNNEEVRGLEAIFMLIEPYSGISYYNM